MTPTSPATNAQCATTHPAKPSWRDVLPPHEAAELLPRISEGELRELGEDIKRNGLREPITILCDIGLVGSPHESLLDGINRLDAMALVGLKVVDGGSINRDVVDCRYVYPGKVDPFDYVLSANLIRRHLSNAQKTELVAKLLSLKPTASDRQIAKLAKVSHPKVAAVRRDQQRRGKISTSPTRTDTRGRQQPATKTKPATSDPAVTAAVERAIARSEENQRQQAASGNGADPHCASPSRGDADRGRRKTKAERELAQFKNAATLIGGWADMVPDLNVPQNLAGEVAAAAIQGIEETIAALRALAERIRTAASASPRDETAVDLANSTPAGQA